MIKIILVTIGILISLNLYGQPDTYGKSVEQQVQLSDQEFIERTNAIFDAALTLKTNGNGFIPGNIAIDYNTDGVIQGKEIIPESEIANGSDVAERSKIISYIIANIGSLPRGLLEKIGKVMSSLPQFDPRHDSFGMLDQLGSALSKVGVHPFSERRIYYFPNGSGDKVICDSIDFYKSNGSPMSMTIDVFTPAKYNDFSIWLYLPGSIGRVQAFLYDNDKVQESVLHRQKGDSKEYWLSKGKDPEYWSIINRFTFYKSGAMASYNGIPFIENFPEINLPGNVTVNGSENGYPPMPNVAEWSESGQLLAMSEPNGYFTFPGNITVSSPRWVRWLNGKKYGDIYVQCNMERLTKLFFKKGTYTLYKSENNDWKSYQKEFIKDTTITVQGFIVTNDGKISAYW